MYCDQCGKRFPGSGIFIETELQSEIVVCEKCASDRIDNIIEKIRMNWHYPTIKLFDSSYFQVLYPPELWENRVKTLMDFLGQEVTLTRFERIELYAGFCREVDGVTA